MGATHQALLVRQLADFLGPAAPECLQKAYALKVPLSLSLYQLVVSYFSLSTLRYEFVKNFTT